MRLVLAFAFGAGLVSPLNPCGFGLLPAYLASQLDAAGPQTSFAGRLWRGLAAGGSVSAGFAGVLVSVALLVSLGLRPILQVVPYVAVAIGVALAVAGGALLAGRALPLGPLSRLSALTPQASRPPSSLVGFGASYAAASVACTLAILLAVVGQAVATGSLWRMVAVVGAYGLGAATLLTALTVSTAVLGTVMATRLRRALPYVRPLSAVLLVLSGLYLIATNVPGLRDLEVVLAAQGWLMSAAASAAQRVQETEAVFAPLAVLLVVLAAGLYVRRRRSGRPADRGNVRSTERIAAADCCATEAVEPRSGEVSMRR